LTASANGGGAAPLRERRDVRAGLSLRMGLRVGFTSLHFTSLHFTSWACAWANDGGVEAVVLSSMPPTGRAVEAGGAVEAGRAVEAVFARRRAPPRWRGTWTMQGSGEISGETHSPERGEAAKGQTDQIAAAHVVAA